VANWQWDCFVPIVNHFIRNFGEFIVFCLVISQLALVSTLPDTFDHIRSLDELVRQVQVALRSSGTLITQITPTSQVILANSGLDLPGEYASSTPLHVSICRHAVAMDFPLVIDNARNHPLLQANPVIPEFGLGAYLGAPIHVQEGKAMGALCALEFHERRWTSDDIRLILAGARAADRLIIRSV